jgi:GT2 family glycosyltransferase
MIRAGWKVVFHPLAEIIHYHGQTRKQYLARDTFIMYQSRLYFFSKHYGPLANFLIRMLTVVDAAFRYVLSSVSSHDRSGQKEKLLNAYKRVFQMSLSSNRSPVSWKP